MKTNNEVADASNRTRTRTEMEGVKFCMRSNLRDRVLHFACSLNPCMHIIRKRLWGSHILSGIVVGAHTISLAKRLHCIWMEALREETGLPIIHHWLTNCGLIHRLHWPATAGQFFCFCFLADEHEIINDNIILCPLVSAMEWTTKRTVHTIQHDINMQQQKKCTEFIAMRNKELCFTFVCTLVM